MANTDIVVVGAGPTGLTMALELASQSVAFRLVDKAEQPSTQSRALLMHARSIELLSRHGLREKLLNSGISPEGVSIIVRGQEVFKVQVPNMATLVTDSAHPSPLVIHQSETERILLDALQTKYGISPERGVIVDNIKQDDTGASLTLNGQAVRCKYIVGADGAHSVVRHSAPDMTFDGAQYPQDFILCDAEVRPGPNSRSLNRVHFCLGQGLLVLLPLDGSKMVRLVASRAGKFAAKAGKEQPTLADFQEFLDDMAPGFGTLHDPVWMTRYRLHHRGVNMYREGRLFVAGDAAHIHSPAMGQGMNTGIQDAVNLGWKLAAAVRHADTSLSSSPSPSSTATSSELIETLLDSYHVERHPVGQKLLSSTDYAFTWFTWNNPLFLALRNTLMPYIVPRLVNRSAGKQIQAFRFMSQLGIRYAKSPIVKTGSGFKGPVRGGSRAPDGRVVSAGAAREKEEPEKWLLSQLAGNRHTLLLFSGAGAGTATERGLEAGRARFVETAAATAASADGNGQVDVFTVYASGVTPAAHTDKAYTEAEPGNVLHERYGFQDKAGYVYLRPDLYIAHIGYLESSMDELLESLRTYL